MIKMRLLRAAFAAMTICGALGAQIHEFPRKLGYIPMKDGTQIAYTAYFPQKEGRFPTAFIYNMYDASAIEPDFNQTPLVEISDFLERGYAVVGANARGTGCSSGIDNPVHAETIGRDGAEVVEWLAQQSWSDGGIGMFGHSGSGMTQFYVAAQQPPHLKAIVPGAAPADFYRDLAYPGGLFNYAFMYLWSDFAQPTSSQRAIDKRLEWGDTQCRENIRDRKKGDFFEQLKMRPLKSAWWEERSIYPIASRIKTPTYIIFGWQDQNVDSRAGYVFNQLAGPKKMLLAEDSHSMYIKSPVAVREKMRFLDYWVRGIDNGMMEGKPIKVWWTMRGAVETMPDEVKTYERIPAPETRWTSLYLTPEGGFDRQPYRGPEKSLQYLYPMGSAFVYGGDSHPHEPYRLGGSLRFRSEPLERAQRMLGQTFAELFVSATAGDTSFFVALSEIRKDGSRKYLQRGYLKASLRDPDADLSAPAEFSLPFEKVVPTEPGKIIRYVIETNATGSTIAEGSMLELQVMAPLTIPEPVGQWGFMPLELGHNTLHFSAGQAPRLVVPIVD